jgi:hypothetical protein
MRLWIMYLIGVVALGVGFVEFWQRDTIDQTAFLTGTTCIIAAAAMHVIRDLWRRPHRR